MNSIVIRVGGMSCQGCVSTVTTVLTALPGVSDVLVTLAAGEARVGYDPALVSPAALCATVEEAGFDASLDA
jgi:copper chaperone